MIQCSSFTLPEWLDYLENRHYQEIQLGLSRIRQVAERLNLLTSKAKIITIAGTNGKGSTVAALEAIYLAAGYQVASYTSPHLLEFNERIKINQQPISDALLCKAFSLIEQQRGKVELTYFEMATLAALWYFKQHDLDLIILEVGLGGRLDATNIVDSDLAIITTIDFDHQDYLGDTLEAIGYEKAGIIRPNKPFIFADKNPPASIVNQAARLNTRSYFYAMDYNFRLADETIELDFQGQQINLPKPKLNNQSTIAAIIASILLKRELPVTPQHWDEALKMAFLPARLELINTAGITTLLDVSHNPQGAKLLAQFVKSFSPKRKVYAVFSAFKDKNISELIAPLRDCVDYWFLGLLGSKRAATKEQLSQVFESDLNCPICYNDPLLAYKNAYYQARKEDLIVVYGSFATVSAVLPFAKNLAEGELTKGWFEA